MTPLDLLRMRKKRSASELVLFSKKKSIEVEFYTKAKKKVHYYINSLAIEYEGRKCLLGMGLDLTDRKKPKR
jgi:hypothetical protein